MIRMGIIANPASGKDIRRLVSYATTIDNNEKVNIVKRIVLAGQAMGVEEFLFMPDTFQIGFSAADSLESDGALQAACRVLDIPLTASQQDTVVAAREMERQGVGCVVVLGGDGTSRAAAKGLEKVPILPLSTGTNNVYPAMAEGTVAGMAAACICRLEDPGPCVIQDKRIEVWSEGRLQDIALIDVVISDDMYVGARAIWDPRRIRRIVVSRCHPASIGFSAAAGCLRLIGEDEDLGFAMELGGGGEKILAPIAAGTLTSLEVAWAGEMPLNQPLRFVAEEICMAALDGERELRLKKGQEASIVIKRNGPFRVKLRETLEEAVRRGMFRIDI